MKSVESKADREPYKAKGSGKNGATLNLAAVRRARKRRVKSAIDKLVKNDERME